MWWGGIPPSSNLKSCVPYRKLTLKRRNAKAEGQEEEEGIKLYPALQKAVKIPPFISVNHLSSLFCHCHHCFCRSVSVADELLEYSVNNKVITRHLSWHIFAIFLDFLECKNAATKEECCLLAAPPPYHLSLATKLYATRERGRPRKGKEQVALQLIILTAAWMQSCLAFFPVGPCPSHGAMRLKAFLK